MKKPITVLFAIIFAFSGMAQMQTTTYITSDSIIANPERGFYRHNEWNSASKTPLNVKRLKEWRKTGVTQVLCHYYLKDYFNSDTIGTDYIALINKNMQAIREAGFKCILRFSYSYDTSKNDPYDPNLDIILKHIAQLKPILQDNADIIEVMQAGFIGTWGEWYYTQHDNTAKAQVIDSLLDALPVDRQIALRTPGYKITYLSSDTPLDETTAFSGSPQSRLASHNDAVLNGDKNQGTFRSDSQKEYQATDTKYVSNGGETDAVVKGYTDNADEVVRQLSAYHMSYLNRDYHEDVLNSWKTISTNDADSTLYNKVEKRLGYRLELESVQTPVTMVIGQHATIDIKIRNTGWAAPFNKHNTEIAFEDNDGNIVAKTPLPNTDVRKLYAQTEAHEIIDSIVVPELPTGEYHLLLNISDSRLADNPLYSIRMASKTVEGKDVWKSETGMNDLNVIVTVTSSGTTSIENGTTINNTNNDNLKFDLQGRRIAGNYHGIVIQKGKKLVVR